MKQKILNLYQRHRFISSIIAVLVLFIFGSAGLVVVNGETLEPNDSHVVILYSDGKTYDVPSRSRTVGEFLQKAKASSTSFIKKTFEGGLFISFTYLPAITIFFVGSK